MSLSNVNFEMSNPSTNTRSETRSSLFLTRLDRTELRGIKVAITRRNITDPSPSTTLLRALDDPSQLVVHFRPDEGRTPIFDREDIIVNQEKQEERTILSSKTDQKAPSQAATSRSSSRSSRSSTSPTKAPERKRGSPQPHTSREAPRERGHQSSRYRRSQSPSRKAVYKSRRSPTPPSRSRYSRSPPRYPKRRTPSPPDKSRPRRESQGGTDKRYGTKPRSRSPNGYRGPQDRRRSSRSPPTHKRYSRSPYRAPERKRSRSPGAPRGRSRSRSPYRSRSRYSRSPHRHEDHRRYDRDRSKRSRSRHRYTPDRRRSPRDERGYQGPRIPSHPYFEGAEFWIPDPSMQPRFIPRQMIPPGAFAPFVPPFRPGMPMMVPPRMPFRPRIVYNSNRPPRPRTTPAAVESSSANTTSTTTTSINVPSSTSENREKEAESEHSSPKNDENKKE